MKIFNFDNTIRLLRENTIFNDFDDIVTDDKSTFINDKFNTNYIKKYKKIITDILNVLLNVNIEHFYKNRTINLYKIKEDKNKILLISIDDTISVTFNINDDDTLTIESYYFNISILLQFIYYYPYKIKLLRILDDGYRLRNTLNITYKTLHLSDINNEILLLVKKYNIKPDISFNKRMLKKLPEIKAQILLFMFNYFYIESYDIGTKIIDKFANYGIMCRFNNYYLENRKHTLVNYKFDDYIKNKGNFIKYMDNDTYDELINKWS